MIEFYLQMSLSHYKYHYLQGFTYLESRIKPMIAIQVSKKEQHEYTGLHLHQAQAYDARRRRRKDYITGMQMDVLERHEPSL
jgi:hypothetical protein